MGNYCGQLGVEIWAAEVVMELQMEYPHLKYAVITPFLEQEKIGMKQIS